MFFQKFQEPQYGVWINNLFLKWRRRVDIMLDNFKYFYQDSVFMSMLESLKYMDIKSLIKLFIFRLKVYISDKLEHFFSSFIYYLCARLFCNH